MPEEKLNIMRKRILPAILSLFILGLVSFIPHADTLIGSRHSNMKELRFNAEGGVWRVAFAFDPKRKGILLVAGNKAGVDQRRFYKRLVAIADQRFGDHLGHMPEKG